MLNPVQNPASRAKRLKVFLCHASEDKPLVRDLYKKLKASDVEPWLDEIDLLPGQELRLEIPRVIRACHVVLVCLSETSVQKTGYVQFEVHTTVDWARHQPEGAIYLIPVRLNVCKIPERLRDWLAIDLFKPSGLERLMKSLAQRAMVENIKLNWIDSDVPLSEDSAAVRAYQREAPHSLAVTAEELLEGLQVAVAHTKRDESMHSLENFCNVSRLCVATYCNLVERGMVPSSTLENAFSKSLKEGLSTIERFASRAETKHYVRYVQSRVKDFEQFRRYLRRR